MKSIKKLFSKEKLEEVNNSQSLTENWINVHEDFSQHHNSKPLQQYWEELDITYQEALKLIKLGFNPWNYNEVEQWKNRGFDFPQIKFWKDIGLTTKDHKTAAYLRWKGYQQKSNLNLKKLEKEFNTWEKGSKSAQNYLDFIRSQGNNTIKSLDISNKKLTDSLDLSNFSNLEQLNCSNNELTSLKIDNCSKLKYLNLGNNDFSEQDLSFLDHLTDLEWLEIGNWNKNKIQQDIYNRFKGSLEPLKNMSKLEYLDISNTDINRGVEHLPNSLGSFNQYGNEKISYSIEIRPESKLKEIAGKLTSFLLKNLNNENLTVDEFIQKSQQKIPYEQLADIEYLAEGGFGKVYKAKWFDESLKKESIWDQISFFKKDYNKEKKLDYKIVALKSLNGSRNMTTDFLQETTLHKLLKKERIDSKIVEYYGISQDPETGNYLMVMSYMNGGNLRQYLKKNYNRLAFFSEFDQLRYIAKGLKNIHDQGLIHRDFHSGNILRHFHSYDNNEDNNAYQRSTNTYISDLGLCLPADETNQKKIYGVLPYVAPEVLLEKHYTPATDIYSFGIVAYEIFSGFTPYHHLPHNELLALCICQGLRPSLNNVQIPQLLENLIEKCWDADPTKRPTANEICKILDDWFFEVSSRKNTKFSRQCEEITEIEKLNQMSVENLDDIYQIHSQAIYTSRPLDYNFLPKPQNSKEINEKFYKFSRSVNFDTMEINKFLEKQAQSAINKSKENKDLDLIINDINLDELNIQTETSTEQNQETEQITQIIQSTSQPWNK